MKRLGPILIGVLAASWAMAAQQVINVGSAPNDGTGDTLRSAMQKANANFTELYDGKQPLNAELTDLAAISAANDDFIQRKAGEWVNRSVAQIKSDLALTKADVGLANVDNTADSLKNVATAEALASNGTNCASGEAAAGVSAAGNAEGCAAYYGPSGTDVPVADGGTGASTDAGARTNLGVVIGTNVEAWDADLDTWATKTPPSGAPVGTTDTQALTGKTIDGDLNTLQDIGNSSLTNSGITLNGASVILGGTRNLNLASSDFANQGTTTTVLHGNAAGNPSFGAVSLSADVTGTLADGSLSSNIPLKNAANTYTGIPTWSSAEPRTIWSETDQGTDLKNWDCDVQAGVFTCRTRTDADGAGRNWLAVTRGATIATSSLALGDATSNPTFTLLGTGTLTTGGSVTVGNALTVTNSATVSRLILTGTTPSGTGLYLNGGSSVGFSVGGSTKATLSASALTTSSGVAFTSNTDITAGASVSATTSVTAGTGFLSAGTKFTATGCSNSTTVGGSTAGRFTSGTTGTCTVAITLPTAANGWTCVANDITTPVVFTQTASSSTGCTVSGTTVSGDVISFLALGY